MKHLPMLVAALALNLVQHAEAQPLDPMDYASVGALPAGDFIIDTDALTWDGSAGGVVFDPGGDSLEAAVFSFDGDAFYPPGAEITVVGARALVILFRGSARFEGRVDVSGNNGGDHPMPSRGIGGPGAFDGGTGGFCSDPIVGAGPGGGGEGRSGASRGWAGGGAGFGSIGARGAVRSGVPGGDGGPIYGDLHTALIGGSGGGGGGSLCGGSAQAGGGGGGGGGAIEIGATTRLEFFNAQVLANGGDGGVGAARGGGGSGGAIFLHAHDVYVDHDTVLRANGGVGTQGGGGRILVMANDAGNLCDLHIVRRVTTTGISRDPGPIEFETLVGLGAAPPTLDPGAPLDPSAFTSLGTFPTSDSAFDTTALTWDGSDGGVLHRQEGCALPLAVYTFDGDATLSGTVTVTGRYPIALLFQGGVSVSGTIDLTGGGGTVGTTTSAGPRGEASAGGFPGGLGNICNPSDEGAGFGGGVQGTGFASSAFGGGGGAAFGGDGIDGLGTGAGAGGVAYGPLPIMHGGSGGGGGGGHCGGTVAGGGGAGGGGGGLEIGALTSLDFVGGIVRSNGGDGADGAGGNAAGGGGGSGGSIHVHAFAVSLDADTVLEACGGAPGVRGGAGAGGRIRVVTNMVDGLTNTTPTGAVQACGGGADGNEGVVEFLADSTVGMMTDMCPDDPAKTEPGICGCGTADDDTDSDGTEDCNETCPADPGKTEPGTCGCGMPDVDTDGDGALDCVDTCPDDPGDACALDAAMPDGGMDAGAMDAGTDAGEGGVDEGSGCGCRTSGQGSPWLPLIALLAFGRRRQSV